MQLCRIDVPDRIAQFPQHRQIRKELPLPGLGQVVQEILVFRPRDLATRRIQSSMWGLTTSRIMSIQESCQSGDRQLSTVFT